ncbi:MAG: hypothetical protein HZB26_16790 [Candidatus Hydrogenedentes bacterium]|nr:hypothetical protein [Candidatus Hydrogenedentota bacterium]
MTRVLSLLMICALALTACETNPFQKKSAEPAAELAPLDSGPSAAPAAPAPEPGLKLAPEQRFKDVPLPSGVKEDLEHSYIYESQSLQIGKMAYTSKAGVNELAQFYIRECPAAGWKLDNVVQADGADLFFTKPGKRLTVIIRGGAITKGRSLTISLTPDAGV